MTKEAKLSALLDNVENYTRHKTTFTEMVHGAGIFPSCRDVPICVKCECQEDIKQFNKGKISLAVLYRRIEILDLKAYLMLQGHRAPADEEKPRHT